MSPLSFCKREFDIIHPVNPSFPQYFFSYCHYLLWDIDGLERSVVAHALEERDTEARSFACGWGKHSVGGAGADAVGEGFKTLTDCYDEGARDWTTVDPVAREVLRL